MEVNFIDTEISIISLHKIGNKFANEGCVFSKKSIFIAKDLQDLLVHYFVNSFKSDEYYNFDHEIDLNMNELYALAKKIFSNKNQFHDSSINIAKHLYEKSSHPKIKEGEVYVTYFEKCLVNGEYINAIGIFKSENKTTFLRILMSDDNNFFIESEKGIDINKLEKGCIIFNREEEKGFLVAVIDLGAKVKEAKYWTDDFLHISPQKDSYQDTKNIIDFTKSFISKGISGDKEITKSDQVKIINKSLKFFKQNVDFEINDYANFVLEEYDLHDNFDKYKIEYQNNNNINIPNKFTISKQALKKQIRKLRGLIKLDDNFDVLVHNDNNYIERGFDEKKGLFYYQLFFNKEH